MSRMKSLRRLIAALALATVAGLGLVGCGDPATGVPAGNAAAGDSKITKSWGLKPVDSVAALVPAEFKGKPLTNAIYNDFPPEEFLEGGTLVGIQPDIAVALGEVMGVEFKNVPVGSFDALIPGVISGRYQISTGDFGVTKARLGQVDFVTEFPIGTGFAVKKGSAITVDKVTDLCGHSIGVVAGSYFVDQVRAANTTCGKAGLSEITLQTYPNDGARILAITNGRVEITGTAEDSMGYTIASQNVPLVLQKFVYEPVEQAIALPNGSALGPALHAAMKEIVTNGTYAKILKKWGVEHVAYDSAGDVRLLTEPSQAS
jgi:polar amino acid transport system substrate-binding protein